MKYIITNQNEVAIGLNTYHQTIADETKVKGRVVAAGHCLQKDGIYSVFGESIGYGIKSKPEDANVLNSAKEILIYKPRYAV